MALRRANAMDIDLPSEGESVVSLPSQDDSGSDAEVETSWICSCKTACVKPGSDLLNFCKVTRESLQKLDRELHRKRVWLMLRELRVYKKVERGYQLMDTPVCRRIFQKACCVGHTTVKQFLKTVHLDGPPPDARKRGLHCHANLTKMTPEQQDVSKFFYHAWSNYAMHIPTELGADSETPRAVQICVEEELEDCEEDSQKTLRLDDVKAEDLGPDSALTVDGKRYLPHMSWQEFYEMYANWSGKPCHRTSFKRYYDESEWKTKLKIADSQHHGKCTTCEKLKMMRSKAVCETQAKQISEAHSQHVASVMDDRQADTIAEQMGWNSTVPGAKGYVYERSLLNWTQDGMDQAKFKVPRNFEMAKTLQDSWRPQISCHGVTVDGVGKFLFLADMDVGKGGDVQTTVTARALEAACFKF